MAKPTPSTGTGTTDTAASGASTAAAPATAAAPRLSLAERLKAQGQREVQEFGQDGVIYSAEKCDFAIVQGLYYQKKMLAVTSERPFTGYYFKLTQPSKGVTSDGKVVDVPAGTDIIVPENAKLKQQLQKFLDVEDPDHVWEIAIEPQPEKLKVERGDMRVYEFARIGNTPRSRRANMLPQAGDVSATNELSAGASEFFANIAQQQGASASNGSAAARA